MVVTYTTMACTQWTGGGTHRTSILRLTVLWTACIVSDMERGKDRRAHLATKCLLSRESLYKRMKIASVLIDCGECEDRYRQVLAQQLCIRPQWSAHEFTTVKLVLDFSHNIV